MGLPTLIKRTQLPNSDLMLPQLVMNGSSRSRILSGNLYLSPSLFLCNPGHTHVPTNFKQILPDTLNVFLILLYTHPSPKALLRLGWQCSLILHTLLSLYYISSNKINQFSNIYTETDWRSAWLTGFNRCK